jgi:CDP-diacylglycerol---serine O-phosphatidyltransferase
MFVLPNLFTLSSVFCGLYAIRACLEGDEPVFLYRAAIAIFFATFFDMFDGRVARLTKTQSEFGVQLDSLADMATFGVAVSVLVYRWSLANLGFLGFVLAFVYVACGALRLARFNVLASRESGASKYFVGLPIPLAAGTLASMVLANYSFENNSFENTMFGGSRGIAAVTLALAGLMVSSVRYRTFKDFRLSRKSVSIVFLCILLLVALSSQIKPAMALNLLFLGYVGLGLAEEFIFFRRRRRSGDSDSDDYETTEHPDEGQDITEDDEEFENHQEEEDKGRAWK